VYGLIGLVTWVAFLESGIHATVAGVLLAMTIPASARIDPATFAERVRAVVDRFERAGDPRDNDTPTNDEQQAALHTLERAAERVQTPLQRMEHSLHPWVTFAVMPVFALANAGVSLGGTGSGGMISTVPLGILLGLVLGKPIGVTLAAWLAVRSGIASLPSGVTWQHVIGAGWLGGIGFTMALFIAGLAFPDADRLAAAKLGILGASFIAGIVGYILLFRSPEAPADNTDD
jgi:NhaA family Na+:H+ antiporter